MARNHAPRSCLASAFAFAALPFTACQGHPSESAGAAADNESSPALQPGRATTGTLGQDLPGRTSWLRGMPVGDPNERLLLWVALDGPPVVEAMLRAGGLRSVDGASVSRKRLAELGETHATVAAAVERRNGQVVADVRRVANALQVLIPARDARRLLEIPGVADAYPVSLAAPALQEALPRLGIPKAWSATATLQGKGLRIGIVDSGVDYTHADFGGSGVPADYTNSVSGPQTTKAPQVDLRGPVDCPPHRSSQRGGLGSAVDVVGKPDLGRP